MPQNLIAPVEFIPTDNQQAPVLGTALCLSGGGYRAMLFHLGALMRLNDLGQLGKLDRVSSVSGGSITAGVLALQWGALRFDGSAVSKTFHRAVVEPIRTLASTTIDLTSAAWGALLPGSAADHLASAYRKHLFGDATLQALPDSPRFIFNATNVKSKALWRFSKPYMADWRVGVIEAPKTELAVAIAASSAFPPVLSPLVLELDPRAFKSRSGFDLQREPYTSEAVLADGGVYDNLGLETAWKNYVTVLVSDAGGMYQAEPDPKRDAIGHTKRIMDLIDNQVRNLRIRQIMSSFKAGTRNGAFWRIWSDIDDYGLHDSLPAPLEATRKLAGISTRLKGLDDETQEKLINWGYAVCDAAMRKYGGLSAADPPQHYPYSVGVGTTEVLARDRHAAD